MNEEAKEAEGEEKEEEEEKEEDKEKEEKEEDFENLSDLELVYKIGKPAGAPGKSGAKHPISLGPFEVYTIDNFGISKHHPMRMSERRKCLEILNIVRSTEGRGKGIGKAAASSTRLLVEMFERLPMKSQLPEYYKIIRYPIDVATIEISLKSGGMPPGGLRCWNRICKRSEVQRPGDSNVCGRGGVERMHALCCQRSLWVRRSISRSWWRYL